MKHALPVVMGVVAALALGSGAAGGQGKARPEANESTPAPPRPRLGIRIDIQVRKTDSIGAYVESVLPGSPADRAGIQAGDLVTKINGQAVNSFTDQPTAGLRLARFVTRLKPNTPISVELRRGRTNKTVSVVAPQEITLIFRGSPDDSGKRWTFPVQPSDSDSGSRRLLSLLASPLASLETAALNPELGSYFGTSEGVLIIKCPPETRLQLKGGDVVLRVNGRRPSNPTQFIRLLQNHPSNEPLRLAVLRHGKRVDITVQPDKADGR